MNLRRLLPLALGTFAIGTDNFIVAGLLPLMADDLRVSVAVAGTQVAVFSIVYAVGTPILASVAEGMERKRALLVSMGVFVIANLVAAAVPSFALLLLLRIVAAAGAAIFSPIATAIAAELADSAHRGRAISIVTGGLTVSLVLGVPIGVLIGELSSWRAAFIFVAVLGAVSLTGSAFTLSRMEPSYGVGFRERFRPAGRPDVAVALLQSFVIIGSTFVVFTYLGSFVPALDPQGRNVTAALLLAYGLAAVAGNLLGGRGADSCGDLSTARAAVAVLACSLGSLSLIAWIGSGTGATIAAAVAVIAWGLSGWAFTPAQFSRLGSMCPDQMPMVFALNTSAIYLGSAAGSLVGGAVVASWGVSALGLVAAVGEVIGLALLLKAVVPSRRDTPILRPTGAAAAATPAEQ